MQFIKINLLFSLLFITLFNQSFLLKKNLFLSPISFFLFGAQEIKADSLDFYINSGNEFLDNNNFTQAIVAFTKAIEINPNDKSGHYGRGYSKIQLKDYRGAIIDLSQAINLDPSFERAYDHRGYAKFFLGDYDGVINDYDQAINLNPNDALYFYKRGFAKQKIGFIKGACQDARKSISLGYLDEGNKRWVRDMCN